MVLGPKIDPIASKVIRDHASRMESKIIDTSSSEISSSLEYDQDNINMAHTMLRVLEESKGFHKLRDGNLVKALKTLPWCRFEITKLDNVDIVIDAAHNEMGMRALMRGLLNRYPDRKFRFVMGFSEDKERTKMMKVIDSSVVSGLHFTQSVHRRATQIRDLIRDVPISLRPLVHDVEMCVEDTVLDAAQRADLDNDVVVVCGSLYMMGEVSNVLGDLVWSDVVDGVVKGAL